MTPNVCAAIENQSIIAWRLLREELIEKKHAHKMQEHTAIDQTKNGPSIAQIYINGKKPFMAL